MRFVSSPEVLERLVTIEKEIVQIESSMQSSESSVGAEAEGIGCLKIVSVLTLFDRFS